MIYIAELCGVILKGTSLALVLFIAFAMGWVAMGYIMDSGLVGAQSVTPEAVSSFTNATTDIGSNQPKTGAVLSSTWIPTAPQGAPSGRQGLEAVRVQHKMVSATFEIDFGGVIIGTVTKDFEKGLTGWQTVYVAESADYLLKLQESDEGQRVLMDMLYGEDDE